MGTDFRLGSSRASVIDVVAGFQTYESKYRYKPGYLDLQREKVRVLSNLHKDNTPTFPRRYDKALISLRSNKNIKVLVSDKGKQTVVCYTSTYNILLATHYSDTDTYKPVEESDVTGWDLEAMTDDLSKKLHDVARRVPDQDIKNSLGALSRQKK